jgi:hypothetical protein
MLGTNAYMLEGELTDHLEALLAEELWSLGFPGPI